ncbi:hypothetical protein CNMCM8694_007753 [Aspergillus lentulus]|nr:hypothetical protein CNMCM8060_005843 [Aspergillus lentulus]KAF4194367.1 hypothetical protein CNMCM8694_007753 [Aspergillus lentulus]
MSAKHEPSLLEYARFYGIAREYTAINPSQQLDRSLQLPPDDPSVPEDKLKSLDKYLLTTQESVEKAICEEKLNVRKEDIRFLSAVLRDVRSHELELNLEDDLAAFHRLNKLKLEPPIFSLDYETHSALPLKPVLYDPEELDLPSLKEAPEYQFECFVEKANEISKEISNEKLNCSKKTFMLIQDAMKLGHVPSNHLDDILANAIRPIISIRSESPPLDLLDVDDLSFKSPSPEPELQMLPSPASTEILEASKPQNHPSKDTDLSHIPEVFDCVQRTSTGGADGMTQIHYHLSAAEGRQTWENATTVGLEEPCEFITFAAEKPRGEGNPQDIQLQVDINIPDLANHDNPSQNQEPASNSAQLADPGVAEKEARWLATDAPVEENTATRLQTNTSATVPNQPLQQRKRKRQLTNESFGKASPSEKREHQKQPAVPSSTTLGSLAAFMETRGRIEKRHRVTQSPYFPGKGSIDDVSKRQIDVVSTEKPRSCSKEPDKSENGWDTIHPATPLPRFQQETGERPILFLSTALLKSHLRLVRCLEEMAGQPVIVYRDYNHDNLGSEPRGKHTTSRINSNLTLQIEADIIISPSTGIILTTSQATTQLYLPGHKSTHPETNIECINSPLRERIFLLAPRYERIYLFICHSAPSSKKLLVKQSGPIADKRVLTSIASLTAFCSSMSAYATISPLLVPSRPETVAGWVLSLANKHIARLPENPTRIPSGTSFTPINSAQKNRLRPEMMMRTTVREMFLRQAGLNPYAAQVILAFLSREDEEERTYIRYKSPTAASSSSVEEGGTQGLARFIEMEPDRRKEVFGELIGDRMMGRINHILDKDWQCDWALNFDADTEL